MPIISAAPSPPRSVAAPRESASPSELDAALPGVDTDAVALADALRARVLRWSISLGGDTTSAHAAADAAAALIAAQHEGHVCIHVGGNGASTGTASASRQALIASKVVAQADDAGTWDADLPFVLDAAGRLYLQRVFDDERAIARRLAAAGRVELGTPTRDVRSQLQARVAPTRDADEPDRQALAAVLALLTPVLVISGGPGTGKTTTLARILELVSMQSPGTRVALAAPTGKAAARMTQALAAARRGSATPPIAPSIAPPAAPLRARTVHSWLGIHPRTGVPRHDARNPLPVDLLVVDEASMLDLELARRLFDALPAQARIVLLGDKDQLAAVQAGAVFAELASKSGASARTIERAASLLGVTPNALEAALQPDTVADDQPERNVERNADTRADASGRQAVVHLVRGYRFDAGSAIARLARSVRDGDADAAIALLTNSAPGDDVAWLAPSREVPPGLAPAMRPYLDALAALHAQGHEADDNAVTAALGALDAWRALCAVHDGPSGTRAWNLRAGALVRAHAAALGHAPAAASSDAWFTGRAVMVTRNDTTLGLVNGDVGIVLPSARHAHHPHHHGDPALRQAAFLRPDGRIARWPVARLPAVETAFATSVHKAQGSEFDRVTLVLPTPWQRPCTRELIYTAITRARRHVSVIADEASLRASIAARTERLGGLGDRLREACPALVDAATDAHIP